MKRITFNIPSYKRADAPMETLKLFPDARIWVAEFEAEDYKKNFPNHEIVVMPDNAQGLWSRARNYLLERMDSDIFYILDDDISSIAEMKGPKLINHRDPEVIAQLLERAGQLAIDWSSPYFGFNTNAQPIAAPGFLPFSLHNPCTGPVSGFLKNCECRYDETVNIKSDWDMAIQAAVKYGKELRVNYLSYKAKINEGTGGSAEQRNNRIEVEQLKLLRRKWGDDIVKLPPKVKWSEINEFSPTVDLVPKIKLPVSGA